MKALHTISTRAWRTTLLIGAATIVMLAASLSFGTTAHAAVADANLVACPAIYPAPSWCSPRYSQWRTAYPSFKDWGRVRANDMVCFRSPCGVQSYTAWRLYNGQFYRTSLRPGTEVYIWPYGYGYSWVWTNNTGWLVMQTTDLQYRTSGFIAY